MRRSLTFGQLADSIQDGHDGARRGFGGAADTGVVVLAGPAVRRAGPGAPPVALRMAKGAAGHLADKAGARGASTSIACAVDAFHDLFPRAAPAYAGVTRKSEQRRARLAALRAGPRAGAGTLWVARHADAAGGKRAGRRAGRQADTVQDKAVALHSRATSRGRRQSTGGGKARVTKRGWRQKRGGVRTQWLESCLAATVQIA